MFGSGGNTGFTFGQPAGQQQQQPQQQSGSLFGNAQQAQPQQNAFGAGNTGFGATTFGSQQQQPAGGGLFGQANTQQPSAATGFSFGGQQQQPSTGGFGAPKPATNTFGGFGASGVNANNSATGGFTFGAANNVQQQQTSSNLFGAPAQPAGGGLFGAKPATSGGLFSSAPQQPASGGLFGQQPQSNSNSLFGGSSAGAPTPITQGSSNPPYQTTILQEKDAANNQATFSYQSISCMPYYKGMSFEELRVQDYEQGRKSGSTAGTAPSSGFGFGQQAQGATGFAATQTSGPFGQQQQQPPAGSLFGGQTTQTGGGLFGVGQQQQQQQQPQQPPSGGGLFGQSSGQPSEGGLFGQQNTQQQPANTSFSFGANNNNQHQPTQQQPVSTGFSFGGNNNNIAPKPGGLFGGFGSSTQTNAPSTGAFSFGQQNQQQQQQQQQQPGQAGMFGGGTGTGFSFGGANAQKPGGLFGSSQTTSAPSANSTFGGFGGASSAAGAQNNKSAFSFGAPSTSGTGFGAAPAAPAGGGLFGGQSAQPTTTSQPAPSGGLFGGFVTQNNQQTQQQPGQPGTLGGFSANTGSAGGLFGGPSTGRPGGLFGGTTSQPAGQSGFGGGTSGGFSFGGASQQQSQQQQAKPSGFTFGQTNTNGTGGVPGGLLGGTAGTTGTCGMFGNTGTQGQKAGGLFGGTSNNNQAGGGGGLFGASTLGNTQESLFGASTNQQQQLQQPLLQSSLPAQGVGLGSDPYGTDALFRSMTGGGAINQPPLPFNVSSSASSSPSTVNALSASARSRPLPAPMMSPFRTNPKNASRVIKLRGGTPARDASPSASTALFGRSSSPAVNGSRGLFHGLSDEIGSSIQDGGLPAQAFVGRSNVKRLVLTNQGNTGWGRGARAGTEDLNGSTAGLRDSVFGARSGTVPPKLVSRGVAFSPALETGIGKRDQTVPVDETFADDLLQRSRSGLFTETPCKANGILGQGRDLLGGKPAMKSVSEKEPSLSELPDGAYYVSPSVTALRRMGYSSLSQVDQFTVTRKGFGSVRFLTPVDLTSINDLTSIPGGIVQFRDKEIWVYPQGEDLEDGLDGMQPGYDQNSVPKAKQGQGLNVPAEVTLERCWPLDKATRKPLKDASHPRVKQHTAKLQKKAETRFRDFDAVAGRWTFEVDHFSRYGLDSSEEEDAPSPKCAPDSRKTSRRRASICSSDSAPPPRRRLHEQKRSSEGPPSLTSASSGEDDYDEDDHELESQASSEMHESEIGVEVKESTPRRPAVNRRSMTPRTFRESNAAVPQESLAPGQAWAAQLGLEPRRVQVMQASFFGNRASGEQKKSVELKARTPGMKRDNNNVKKIAGGIAEGSRMVPKREQSSFTLPNLKEELRPSVSPFPQLTDLTQVNKKLKLVDLQDSITKGHEGVPLDAGLAFGRSFRVGWGPGGKLIHRGKLLGVMVGTQTQNETTGQEYSTLRMDKIGVFTTVDEAEEVKKALRLLEIQLQHSEVASGIDAGEAAAHDPAYELCPKVLPDQELRFGHFAAQFEPADRCHEPLVWRLGKVLFDEIDLRLPADVSNENLQTVISLRRKEALSSWLSHAVAATVEAECRSHVAGSRKTALIFSHLSGYQIEKACCAALDSGNSRLATLLAEAGGGDDETRADIAEQLVIWRNEGVDAHISKEHRRIYEVLAGNVIFSVGTANRTHRDPGDRLDDLAIASGLDWKRAFGLHLWYGTSFDTPLTTSFERYEAAVFSSTNGDTAPPLPPYREKAGLGNLRLRELLRTNSYDRDALFYLIKLYADPTFDLETALSPFGFGPSISDYRLPWHLYVLLSRILRRRDFADRQDLGFEAARYTQHFNSSLEGNSATADNLTSNYAHQLELQGQWTWAAFVLLHLELPASRSAALKALLARNVNNLDDKSMTFLTAKLRIPRTWIYEAQAIAARYSENRFGEFELLIKAKLFVQAHVIAVRHLAPEAIIRGDLSMILSLFSPFPQAFPDGRLSSYLSGWTTGGQLYVDYVACVQQLPYLIAASESSTLDESSAEQLARLAPRVMELLYLVPLHLFPGTGEGAVAEELCQVVARSDMLASLHNLARVLSIRKLLSPEAEANAPIEAATATWSKAAGVPPEIEHVQNAANDFMSSLLQEA